MTTRVCLHDNRVTDLDTALLVLVGEVADVVQSQQTRGCVQGEVIAGV